MKFIKFLVIILLILAIVAWVFLFKWGYKKIVNIKKANDTVNSIIKTVNWSNSGSISVDLSGTIDEVKWYAQQYYNDVLSGYVNQAKQDLSWTVTNLKWRYNEWVDSIWDTITNKVSDAIVEELNKLKIK